MMETLAVAKWEKTQRVVLSEIGQKITGRQ
jgi:hypothetical protein